MLNKNVTIHKFSLSNAIRTENGTTFLAINLDKLEEFRHRLGQILIDKNSKNKSLQLEFVNAKGAWKQWAELLSPTVKGTVRRNFLRTELLTARLDNVLLVEGSQEGAAAKSKGKWVKKYF